MTTLFSGRSVFCYSTVILVNSRDGKRINLDLHYFKTKSWKLYNTFWIWRISLKTNSLPFTAHLSAEFVYLVLQCGLHSIYALETRPDFLTYNKTSPTRFELPLLKCGFLCLKLVYCNDKQGWKRMLLSPKVLKDRKRSIAPSQIS